MTREAALAAVRGLTGGLPPDLEGTRRLLEHVSTHAEAEALRDALTELGARRVLEREDR